MSESTENHRMLPFRILQYSEVRFFGHRLSLPLMSFLLLSGSVTYVCNLSRSRCAYYLTRVIWPLAEERLCPGVKDGDLQTCGGYEKAYILVRLSSPVITSQEQGV
jgi:hypothetical protein